MRCLGRGRPILGDRSGDDGDELTTVIFDLVRVPGHDGQDSGLMADSIPE